MYEYATQATLYYPTKESGAIGWDDMKQTLASVGFTCENCSKPATYEEFQEQMTHTDSAIVLVSSGEDDTFWKDTAGHYVNILPVSYTHLDVYKRQLGCICQSIIFIFS